MEDRRHPAGPEEERAGLAAEGKTGFRLNMAAVVVKDKRQHALTALKLVSTC